jgi:hypothetical protein
MGDMGRPKKDPGESLVEVPCKVPQAVADVIAKISDDTDRSRSQVARKLIIRGLASYYRDGRLDEANDEPKSQEGEMPEEIRDLPEEIIVKPSQEIRRPPKKKIRTN